MALAVLQTVLSGTISEASEMGYKNFRDSENRRWEVWLVLPSAAERRKNERRIAVRTSAVQYAGPERRKSPRRLNPFHQAFAVPRGYEHGWLCFECENGEKRRLAPIPDEWETSPDERLQVWCRLAIRVVKCGP